MKQIRAAVVTVATAFALVFGFVATASTETKVTLNDFYRPFELSEINPKNMQSWPYYRYTSMNWDDYGLFGTGKPEGSGAADKAAIQQVNEGGSPRKSCRVNCPVRTRSDAGARDR